MLRNAYNEAISRIAKDYIERGDVFSIVINSKTARNLADVTSKNSPERVYHEKDEVPVRTTIMILLAQEERKNAVTLYSDDFNTSLYNIRGNKILQIIHDSRKGALDYANLAREIDESVDKIDRNETDTSNL